MEKEHEENIWRMLFLWRRKKRKRYGGNVRRRKRFFGGNVKQRRKLDPVGSTVRYEMMKL